MSPEPSPESRNEPETLTAPTTTRSRRSSASRANQRWSGLPVAASLALVAFAVLFGIYGPRVVDRATPPLGIPAWDLGEAAAERHLERLMGAIHGPGADTVTVAEAEAEVRSILGVAVKVPDGSARGFSLFRPRAVSLPGAGKAALVFYARSALAAPDAVSLILVPDREQYVVFSPFGRPLFLPAWEVFRIDLPNDGGVESSAVLWSDGIIVRVAVAFTAATLAEAEQLFLEATPTPGEVAEIERNDEPTGPAAPTPPQSGSRPESSR